MPIPHDPTAARFVRPSPRPGEHLLEDWLPAYGLTPETFAAAAGVTPARADDLLNEGDPLTIDWALRLEALFGQPAEFWLALQAGHDLSHHRLRGAERPFKGVQRIEPPPPEPIRHASTTDEVKSTQADLVGIGWTLTHAPDGQASTVVHPAGLPRFTRLREADAWADALTFANDGVVSPINVHADRAAAALRTYHRFGTTGAARIAIANVLADYASAVGRLGAHQQINVDPFLERVLALLVTVPIRPTPAQVEETARVISPDAWREHDRLLRLAADATNLGAEEFATTAEEIVDESLSAARAVLALHNPPSGGPTHIPESS